MVHMPTNKSIPLRKINMNLQTLIDNAKKEVKDYCKRMNLTDEDAVYFENNLETKMREVAAFKETFYCKICKHELPEKGDHFCS